MALFQTSVAVNMTNKGDQLYGSIKPAGLVGTSPGLITETSITYTSSLGYYVENIGQYNYDFEGILLGGEIFVINSFDGSPTSLLDPIQIYQAASGEAPDVLKLLGSPDAESYFSRLFKNDDLINGSQFKDKLNGYKGDDIVRGNDGNDKIWGGKNNDELFGGPGNDTLWGGPGKDGFAFAKNYDKDVAKDFDRKKDNLLIDLELAKNMKKLKKAADQKKGDIVFDFGGGDKFTVEDLKLKHLKSSLVEFTDFSLD